MGPRSGTIEASGPGSGAAPPDAEPGLALIFAAGRPAAAPLPVGEAGVELGRDHPRFAPPDGKMSTRHARVALRDDHLEVTDLGSRNGTFVDGERLAPGQTRRLTRVLRLGDSLLSPFADLRALARLGVRLADGHVQGPALQEALAAAARAAQAGTILHVSGESGAGKESLALAFHAAGPQRAGRLVAVNCAAIPEGVAERLLFGARRGAFSGADADAEGYLQAAHGGTLFLDEVAELSLAVQAKLLRFFDTGEVLPLGAAHPRKVELRFCSATHRDLRAQVAAGKLREDLYYRIAHPRVVVPPLRDRPEEMAWLLAAEIPRTSPELALHVSLVEAALLRPWPGNVRELLAEARTAAQNALGEGAARVHARHLGAAAGSLFSPASPAAPAAASPLPTPPSTRRQLVEAALRRAEGNVSEAARLLDMHRTQLRRWLQRHGIDPRRYLGDDPAE